MNKVLLIFSFIIVGLVHGCAAQNTLYSPNDSSQVVHEEIMLRGFKFTPPNVVHGFEITPPGLLHGINITPPKQAQWVTFDHNQFHAELLTDGDKPWETYAITAKIFYMPDLVSPEDIIQMGKQHGTSCQQPRRCELLSNETKADVARKELCALTYTVHEDHSVPNRPKQDGSMHVQSKYLLCQHPGNSNVGIVVGYSRRYDIGDHDRSFEKKSSELFDSVVFTDIPTHHAPKYTNPESIYALGLSYAKGDGVPQDIVMAVKLCTKAAELGLANAQHDLGSMYAKGTGVIQDDAEAVKWFKAAANQGVDRAQNYLGLMYKNGRGVPTDYGLAMTWFTSAAEQGYAMAQVNIALMYEKGEGVTQDYKEAARWYEMAAELGQADAQYTLGNYYYSGQGVSRDYIQAYKWLSLAHINGHTDAFNRRQYAKGYMNPDQIIYAEKLTRKQINGDNTSGIVSGERDLSTPASRLIGHWAGEKDTHLYYGKIGPDGLGDYTLMSVAGIGFHKYKILRQDINGQIVVVQLLFNDYSKGTHEYEIPMDGQLLHHHDVF